MRSTFRLTNYLSSVTWLLLILAVSTTFTTEASKLTSSTQIRRSDIIPSHVFIFGVGYTGLELVSSIKKNFPHCVISGTCRSVEKAADLKKLGIQPFIFDPNTNQLGLDESGRQALSEASHILTMIPPVSDLNSDAVLDIHRQDILNNVHSLSNALEGINEGADVANDVVRSNTGLWVGYVSSTGVYGDHSGSWVTEQSETLAPTTSNAFNRISAEKEWLALRSVSSPGVNSNNIGTVCTVYPHVFRLGAIYGPGRSALDAIIRRNRDAKGTKSEVVFMELPISGETTWVSRIHVADICGAIIASMMAPVTGSEGVGAIYNVADNVPAPRDEVMKYAGDLLSQKSKGEESEPDNSNNSGDVIEIKEVEINMASLLPEAKSETALSREKMVNELTRRRMSENKRVSNAHIVESLGYVFKYPSYKEGLQALLEDSNESSE